MKVRDVMTSNVSSVSMNSSIRDAANQMKSLNVGSIPVCDNSKRPVGIITDRDIVIRNVSQGMNSDTSVNNAMTNNPVTCSPEVDIHDAANLMAKHKIRRLPVVENNQLVGMLSIGDLAVRDIYINEAGSALSNISEPSKPDMR